MDDIVIRTSGLTKLFGPVKALDGLDLEVSKGEVFGFLGPNGAGKSTTIRILLDLVRPTAGTAEVFGQPPHRHRPETRAGIGYLPGELRMPGRATAGEYLHYLTRLRHGRGNDQIAALAERFDLNLGRPIAKLSKGNKQKIGVVQAFIHQPDLLILDEPTSGLDPLLQHEFQDLMKQRCTEGATVFMSSHVLSEIEHVADRVAIIRAGKLVDIEDITTLRHRAGQEVELRFAEPVDIAAFERLAGVSDPSVTVDSRRDSGGGDSGTWVLRCVLRGEPDELLKVAAQHRIVGWNAADRDLDDLFLDYYRDAAPGPDPVAEPKVKSHA
ncbi:MAG: ABC transporter ATP-binding protein [Acidimicrobiales bacterium]